MFDLIGNYVSRMNIEDVNNFLINNNINLSSNELNFCYDYIKNNWSKILNKEFNFNLYKDKFSDENYNKLNELINYYSKKYLEQR